MNALNNALNLTIRFVFDDKIQDLKKPSCDFNRETYGSVHGKLTTLRYSAMPWSRNFKSYPTRYL